MNRKYDHSPNSSKYSPESSSRRHHKTRSQERISMPHKSYHWTRVCAPRHSPAGVLMRCPHWTVLTCLLVCSKLRCIYCLPMVHVPGVHVSFQSRHWQFWWTRGWFLEQASFASTSLLIHLMVCTTFTQPGKMERSTCTNLIITSGCLQFKPPNSPLHVVRKYYYRSCRCSEIHCRSSPKKTLMI